MNRAILFLNGDLKGDASFYKEYIKQSDYLVAADGGAEYLFSLSLTPELIIGDLDSISKKTKTYYSNLGVELEEFPVEKDKTDGELILEKLVEKGFSEIVIFAALGGRVDHQLANIFLLAKFKNVESDLKIVTPQETIQLITDKQVLYGEKDKIISLISLSAKTKGVNLSGFKYNAKDVIINKESTLGVSNQVKANKAKIQIDKGELLLVINH